MKVFTAAIVLVIIVFASQAGHCQSTPAKDIATLPNHGSAITTKCMYSGKAVLDTVWINVNSPRVVVTIQVPSGFPLTDQSFSYLVKQSRPDAAITGTYFNMASHVPVGALVMFGQLIHFGDVGTAMAIGKDRQVTFRRMLSGLVPDWSDNDTVIAAGPTLLKDGVVDIQPEMEKFSDRRIFGSAKRCAVGWRKDGILILAASRNSITLKELAVAFREMGASDAMNLDGGTSTGLYSQGKFLATPGRGLTNLLIAFSSADRFNSYRNRCAYTFYRTGKQFQKNGKHFQAMLNYRGAAAADPSKAVYFSDLALTFSKLTWPVWTSWAYSQAASICEKKGDGDGALSYHKKALDASFFNADSHLFLVNYYEKNKDHERSVQEIKSLESCIFTKAALYQDLYNPPERLDKSYSGHELSWNSEGDGCFSEKTTGMKLRIPQKWEMSTSKPFFALFQASDPAEQRFLCVEVIKSEIFVGLDRIADTLQKKHGAESLPQVCSTISGLQALKARTTDMALAGKPWGFSSLLVRKGRWVLVFTAGAPEKEFSATESLFNEIQSSLFITPEGTI